MATIREITFYLLILISVLFLWSEAKNKPKLHMHRRVCFHRGRFEEKCADDKTECGVNSMGASMGCVTESDCGAAANNSELTCDTEQEICCCHAEENPCNDYTDRNFETDTFCPAFPNATCCLADAENFTQPICKLRNGTLEECKRPDKSVCALDTLGRPKGCMLYKDCPRYDELFYFNPQCDTETQLCCCTPLHEIICNDRSQSPELNALLLDLEEKAKKEDSEISSAMSNPHLRRTLILILPTFFSVLT